MKKLSIALLFSGMLAGQTALAACAGNDDNYQISSQGWVLHKNTGLVWQPCLQGMVYENGICTGDASELTWSQALQAAQTSLSFDRNDWRLPNVKELASLLEFSCSSKVNEVAFPDQPLDSTLWTNTVGAPSPGNSYSQGVVTVRFYDYLPPLNNSFSNSPYSYAPFMKGEAPTTSRVARLVRNATAEDYFQLQSSQ